MNKSVSAQGGWVNGIDSIRFVLAMIVFGSHLENEVSAFLKTSDYALIRWAGIGFNHVFLGPGAVIAFFVISGFVIHYPMKDKPVQIGSFLVRRWLRIGLPLIVVAVFSLYFKRFWLIPIWSLYCELIYYTLYPLLRRINISWKHQFIGAFILSILLVTVAAKGEIKSLLAHEDVDYTGSYAALGDGLTWIVGLPCWLLGVLIADRIDAKKIEISTTRMNLVRMVMLGLSVIIVGLKAHFFVSYIVTLNFFALIVVYWIESEIVYYRNHSSWPLMEWAGKFSYSLYLIHGIAVSFLVSLIPVNILTYPVYIIFTLLFAFIVYLVVEEPSHRLSKYMSKKVRQRFEN